LTTSTHFVDRLLDGEGGAGTGHVHVEAVAAGADGLLDLAGHRRVGALHVGRRAQHAVDVAALLAGGSHRLLRGVDRDLGHQAELFVRPRLEARLHARGVEHARLVDDVALPDARRLLDELDAGVHHRRQFAGGDAARIARVLQVGVGVEGLHQLGVGDDVRRVQAYSATP
jgi:hypothetical protein